MKFTERPITTHAVQARAPSVGQEGRVRVHASGSSVDGAMPARIGRGNHWGEGGDRVMQALHAREVGGRAALRCG